MSYSERKRLKGWLQDATGDDLIHKILRDKHDMSHLEKEISNLREENERIKDLIKRVLDVGVEGYWQEQKLMEALTPKEE